MKNSTMAMIENNTVHSKFSASSFVIILVGP